MLLHPCWPWSRPCRRGETASSGSGEITTGHGVTAASKPNSHGRIVELKLQANDRDYRQGSSASLDFIALSSPSSSLPPPPPPFPAPDASPSEVQNHVNRINVLEFPDPSLWNEAWLQRFRDVTPKELAVFHRQVLQKCAVYLPQSEVYGPESAATKALEQVFESYSTFARKVHALAPQAWSERLEVNMDTLEKLPKKPPPEHLLSILIKEASADDVKLMLLAYNAHKVRVYKHPTL